MDGAPVGRRGERQADGLAAGREPLFRLGDSSAAKTTRMGDSLCFRDFGVIQEGDLHGHSCREIRSRDCW